MTCERDDRILFSELSAEFKAGDIVQIAGPNGAGKTTLLKLVIGLLPVTFGEIIWSCTGADANNATLHESVMYLGHQPAVNLSLTALENLKWYFGLNGRKSLNNRAQQPKQEDYLEALNTVGLSGYEHVLCSQMSAGQHRRVALARLYLSDAPLWILDEPFTAIDKAGVQALENRIERHADTGGVVLLTTHQPLLHIENFRVLDISVFIPKGLASE